MRSILIVDDEFGVAETVSEVLSQMGYTTTTAINGQLGLASVAQFRPDVILLDVMMPVVTGLEMLRALKAHESYRDIPVIMMSAAGKDSIPRDLRDLIHGFVQKPFTFKDLMAVLDSDHAKRP